MSSEAKTTLRQWLLIPPSGRICVGWIRPTRAEAEALRQEEYPGRNRGARVVRVRIEVEESNGAR